MVRRVCLVSGGTGGHLMPAVTLARTLRQRGHEPVLVTEGREVERTMLQRELPDLPALPLPCGAQRPSRWSLPLWLGRATLGARRMLREEHVDCVVSTGGRASVPVGLAARSLGVPLYLLEQNAVTGRANRCLQPFAARIYHGLPLATGRPGRQAVVTGTPLRPEVGRVGCAAARSRFGVSAAAQVVLVVGGSQGAQVLNEVVPQALAGIAEAARRRSANGEPLAVIHLAGGGRDAEVTRFYEAAGERLDARVLPGAGDMASCYAAADLVICRGGGTTVAELAVAARPAVIVPYPHHRDRQQWHNAGVLVAADAAVVVEERELTVEWLGDLLDSLLAAPDRLCAMGRAAGAAAHPDAAAAIVADIEAHNRWSAIGGQA